MNKILHVGIDVDSKSFHVAGVYEGNEIFQVKIRSNSAKLIDLLVDWREQSYEIKVCYEASFNGFELCRALRKAGFVCDVAAPSLIPREPGNHIKTDRLDSLKLAKYYEKNLLTMVYVPTPDDEALRDFIRGRESVVGQLKKTKQHLVAVMVRNSMDYKELQTGNEYWTKRHREWIRSQITNCNIEALKLNLESQLGLLEHIESVIKTYTEKIEEYAEKPELKNKVTSLTCYRGLSVLSAMTIITELGDIKRFSHPRKLMSYLGFDISEYSSGGFERKSHITKLGNRRLRTTLVEACQSARKRPLVGKQVAMRRKLSTAKQIEIADRCLKRLYKKSHRLLEREKPIGKVKVACAREMTGFIWESLMVS